MTNRREFADMSDAFSYCRECDRPVIAIVKGVPYRLYPSGKAIDLTACAKTQYEQGQGSTPAHHATVLP